MRKPYHYNHATSAAATAHSLAKFKIFVAERERWVALSIVARRKLSTLRMTNSDGNIWVEFVNEQFILRKSLFAPNYSRSFSYPSILNHECVSLRM